MPWASGSHHLPAPRLAELACYPSFVGERECGVGWGESSRAELSEGDTLSLEMLKRVLLLLLLTRMCVTKVLCPFISHTGFFEKKGFHRWMRGS